MVPRRAFAREKKSAGLQTRRAAPEQTCCWCEYTLRGIHAENTPLKSCSSSIMQTRGSPVDIQTPASKTPDLFTSQFLACVPNSIQRQLNFNWAVNIM